MTKMGRVRVCFSLAGSDPSGGAGIQADLKTFCAMGCYGAAAPTALTVQSTRGVERVVPLDAALVYEQGRAVMDDLRPDAVKVGMLGTAAVADAVARLLERWRPAAVVVDPVLVSSSGRRLLDADGLDVLLGRLAPLCTVLTPNLPELEVLAGGRDEAAATRLGARCGCAVLVKGGHREGAPVDVLYGAGRPVVYGGTRIATANTHGTGCTLSSAVAARLALGDTLPEAVGEAKRYVAGALRHGAAMDVGGGTGPLNHFFAPQRLLVGENQ